MAEKTIHICVKGRVQGVWFRAWTMQEAKERGLSGWVRNCSDGSVEALFSGGAEAVDAMVAACWNGPPAARVDNVATSPAEPPDHAGFQGLPTK